MSWSDGRLLRALLPLALAAGLSGCFTPLYGGLHGQLGAEMQAIQVDEIPDRLGHYLRDELISGLNGTGSNPAPKYRLAVTTKERVQTALVDIVTRRATAATVVIDTDYVLTAIGSSAPIAHGTVTSAATYDRSEQRYANLRAARDAEIRDAKTIADELTQRIAAALPHAADGRSGMVALKSHEADRFLGGDLAGFALFLVFGPDVGLVSERVVRLARLLVDDPADPFALVRLSGDEVAGDPGRLADEANTMPMFGGRRVIRVDATAKNLVPAVEHHLAAGTGCPVVVEAGNLKFDSALRKLVERARAGVAIECQVDAERDLERLIEAEMAGANVTLDPEARAALGALLGSDRLASRSELAKLILYAHGRPAITLDDVEAVVTDASANATDALIDATFLGDLVAMEHAGRRVLLDGADGGTILSTALRHATFLHRAKLDGGGGDRLRLPFGTSQRRKPIIERQLRTADGEALGRAVMRLGEAVGRARRDPVLARPFALRTLWAVARSVRGRGRPG